MVAKHNQIHNLIQILQPCPSESLGACQFRTKSCFRTTALYRDGLGPLGFNYSLFALWPIPETILSLTKRKVREDSIESDLKFSFEPVFKISKVKMLWL